jgi:hypothetical protein
MFFFNGIGFSIENIPIPLPNIPIKNVPIELNDAENEELLPMLNGENNKENYAAIAKSFKLAADQLKETIDDLRDQLEESDKTEVHLKFAKGKVIIKFAPELNIYSNLNNSNLNIILFEKYEKDYKGIFEIMINLTDDSGDSIATHENLDDIKFLWIDNIENDEELINQKKVKQLIEDLDYLDFKFLLYHVFDFDKAYGTLTGMPTIVKHVNMIQLIKKLKNALKNIVDYNKNNY